MIALSRDPYYDTALSNLLKHLLDRIQLRSHVT